MFWVLTTHFFLLGSRRRSTLRRYFRMLKPLYIPLHNCLACNARRCKLRKQLLVHVPRCPPSMLPALYPRLSLHLQGSQQDSYRRTHNRPMSLGWAEQRNLIVDLGRRVPLTRAGLPRETECRPRKPQNGNWELSQDAEEHHTANVKTHAEVSEPHISDLGVLPAGNQGSQDSSVPCFSSQVLCSTRSTTRCQAQALPKQLLLPTADPKLLQYAHVRLEAPLFLGKQHWQQPPPDKLKEEVEEQHPPKHMISFPPFMPPKRLRLVVSHGAINIEVAASSCEELS